MKFFLGLFLVCWSNCVLLIHSGYRIRSDLVMAFRIEQGHGNQIDYTNIITSQMGNGLVILSARRILMSNNFGKFNGK